MLRDQMQNTASHIWSQNLESSLWPILKLAIQEANFYPTQGTATVWKDQTHTPMGTEGSGPAWITETQHFKQLIHHWDLSTRPWATNQHTQMRHTILLTASFIWQIKVILLLLWLLSHQRGHVDCAWVREKNGPVNLSNKWPPPHFCQTLCQRVEHFLSWRYVNRSQIKKKIIHGGGGGFFFACEDFGRMFDNSFPACAFF